MSWAVSIGRKQTMSKRSAPAPSSPCFSLVSLNSCLPSTWQPSAPKSSLYQAEWLSVQGLEAGWCVRLAGVTREGAVFPGEVRKQCPVYFLAPWNALSFIFQCTLDSSQRQTQNIPHLTLFNVRNLLGKHLKKKSPRQVRQSAKCSLSKQRYLNLEAQHACESQAGTFVSPGLCIQSQGDPGAGQPVLLNWWVSDSVRESGSMHKVREWLRKMSDISLWSHTLVCLHRHKNKQENKWKTDNIPLLDFRK